MIDVSSKACCKCGGAAKGAVIVHNPVSINKYYVKGAAVNIYPTKGYALCLSCLVHTEALIQQVAHKPTAKQADLHDVNCECDDCMAEKDDCECDISEIAWMDQTQE